MNYKFNYKEYLKRCSAIQDYGVSRPLKCFSRHNDGTEFLFPDVVPPCFEFDKTEEEKFKKVELFKNNYLNLEVVAFDRSDNPCIFIDPANNNRIVSILLRGRGNNEISFANSSLEQFAESLMFYREFYQQGWKNSTAAGSKFDLIMNSDMVSTFFENIRSIDMEATKKGSFWKELLQADVLCDEMEKKGINSYKHILPEFYKSDIWKALNY